MIFTQNYLHLLTMWFFIFLVFLFNDNAQASNSMEILHKFPNLANSNPIIRATTLRSYARSIVSSMGTKGLLALVRYLYDPELQVKKQAVESLINIRPTGQEFNQAIIQALKDPDPEVRIATNWVVDSLLIDDPKIIQALLESVNHSNFEVRRSAIHALGQYKITNSLITEKLNNALTDPHEAVKVAAKWAIKQIQSKKSNSLIKCAAVFLK